MTTAPAIFKQTRSGRAFPLPGFTHADIDLDGDVPETLARICRYGGSVPGNAYSVAQHCVIGADAALEETGDPRLAAYVLLHDAHEAVIGDITTPVAKWLQSLAIELYGVDHAGVIDGVIACAKAQLDLSVWRAAGLPRPGAAQQRVIAQYDLRLLATEKRQLLVPARRSWGAAIDAAEPLRIRGRLTAWPVARAAEEYRLRVRQLCPNAGRF